MSTTLSLTGASLARAFALACGVALCGSAWAGTGADLILTNGHVYTADAKLRWAEAVAVKGGKIVYVGSSADAKARGDKNTKEIDLAGRLLLPGFIDEHDHVDGLARHMFWADLGDQFSPHTLESYQQAILAYRAKHPDLKQMRGRGFDPWILPGIAQSRKRQPRDLLDEIVNDVPVIIVSWTGHQAWINTKAIELAGITKDTPNPSNTDDGAGIGHDPATGEPNGFLFERAAFNLVLDKLPEPADFTLEQYRTGILAFQREMAAPRGITGVMVPTGYPTENLFIALQQLSDDGLLTMSYSVAQWANDLRGFEQVPDLVARRAKFRGGPHFKFNTVKILLPWPHPQSELNSTFAALDKQGFQLYVHVTVGPIENYARPLDALEYARKQNGSRDSRHLMTHNRAQTAPLAARFKALGVRADLDFARVSNWYLTPKAFLEAGVPIALSSDYPAKDPSPLAAIAECVKHGLPLEALIDSVTISPATAQFFEKETGSITVGKAADLIVMDRDLFKVTPEEIGQAKVLLTLFAGKELYRDPAF